MAAIDFITALGRLLHDGKLRDRFSENPTALAKQLSLSESDWPMFLRLVPSDLEFQAKVLLRKRFNLVRDALPQTCGRLGDDAWLEFQRYGRSPHVVEGPSVEDDVTGFCRHVAGRDLELVDPVEFNRLRFAQARRPIAFYLVPAPVSARPAQQGVQVFIRYRNHKYEWLLYFGL